jgi:hypothetical protein
MVLRQLEEANVTAQAENSQKVEAAKAFAANRKLIGETVPGYKHYTISGFPVLVHKDVIEHNDDRKFAISPLEVLDLELGTIATILPQKHLKVLRQVAVWVEWDDVTDPDYGSALAKYYGVWGDKLQWSLSKGKHPLKANNLEIVSMQKLTQLHQPWTKFERCMILHELCHAVHAHVLGLNNSAVETAYALAMQRGLYSQAKDIYDRTVTPYARVSAAEYFAEVSSPT